MVINFSYRTHPGSTLHCICAEKLDNGIEVRMSRGFPCWDHGLITIMNSAFLSSVENSGENKDTKNGLELCGTSLSALIAR